MPKVFHDGVDQSKAVFTNQRVELASNFTTTSTSYTDITGLSITLANRSNGKFMSMFMCTHYSSVAAARMEVTFDKGGTNEDGISSESQSSMAQSVGVPFTNDLDGDTLKMETKVQSGTLTIEGQTLHKGTMETLEVG